MISCVTVFIAGTIVLTTPITAPTAAEKDV
jgi:hypothetical protein